MLVEVGKTYVNRAGYICKVLSRTDEFYSFFSYFPLKDGKENREKAFHIDKYGFSIHRNSDGEPDSHDLIKEYKMPDYKWIWCTPDKVGLWICDEGDKNTTPTVEGATIYIIPSLGGGHYLQAWRCYLGPIPQIAQPKKPVKQTLWMVKYLGMGAWQELWLSDEEAPKNRDYQDVVHKTCTTRTV